MNLIEVSAWPWLDRLSRRERQTITLDTVPAAEWDALARNGHHWIFLMGVWRRSPIGREIAATHAGLLAEYSRVLPDWTAADVVGSPYCVQAYEPDERMGGWQGLDTARRALEARGMSLMLDFVPNHTAFDHPWVQACPDRYVLGSEAHWRAAPGDFRAIETARGTVQVACGRDPYFPPWSDVAQLNLFNPDTRHALQEELRSIAAHCDGVRCDMAMLPLNVVFEATWRRVLQDQWSAPGEEFWPAMKSALPGLRLLAEAYWDLEGTLLDQGFDYAYDKRLLDALESPDAAQRLRDLLARTVPPQHRLARFVENHDEPRSAAVLGGRLTAAAALVCTAPGLRFFYDGQFEGRTVKTPVQLGRWPDEAPNPSVRELYDRALRFGAADLLTAGEWSLLTPSPAGDQSFAALVAYQWRLADALAIIAVNPGDAPAQAHLSLAGALPAGSSFDFVDHLTDARYRWSRADLDRTGLFVRLDRGQAHLLTVESF